MEEGPDEKISDLADLKVKTFQIEIRYEPNKEGLVQILPDFLIEKDYLLTNYLQRNYPT